MTADNAELSELMDSIDLQSWLDAHDVVYRSTMGSRGPQFNVKECPVCGNDAWKLYLNAETGLGNCFAGSHPRGKNFNKFSFMRAVMGDGLTGRAFVDDLKRNAKEFGWRARRTVAVATSVSKGSPKLPHSLSLPIKGKNLAYLQNRGIDVQTANYFGLRFCLKGSFAYTLSDGLTRYQDYSNRILIPIHDLDGTLVSFQGRDITNTSPKKYLFPPGYAATGEYLFNGHNVLGTKRIVVGEGVFDVMALKLGLDADPALRDVVAIGTFGKHLSFGSPQSQLEKFKRLKEERGVEEVTLCWDGEVVATDDAIDAGERLRGIGLRVRVMLLPAEKDPNEIPAEKLRECYYKAITLTKNSASTIAIERRITAKMPA